MGYLVLGCPRCLGTVGCVANRTPFPCPRCGEWCQLDRTFTTLLAFPTPPPMIRGDGRRVPLTPPTIEWAGRPPGWQPGGLLMPEPTTPAAWVGLAIVAAIIGFIIGRLTC